MLAAGCADPPPRARRYLLHPPPVPVETRDVDLYAGLLHVHLDVPIGVPAPMPAVIAYIGDRDQVLAAGGIAVTYRMDWKPLIGPRPVTDPKEPAVGKLVLASPSYGVLGRVYLQGIVATAEAVIPVVLDYLETVPEVDSHRIAYTGGSTNGFTGLQAIMVDRRIRVASIFSACGDYHRFLRDSSFGMEGRPLELFPHYDRWLRRIEPVRHPRRLVHAKLLLVSGTADPIVPISCVDATAHVFERTWRRAGRAEQFRYVREPGHGHGIGPDERFLSMVWLQRWLFHPPVDAD